MNSPPNVMPQSVGSSPGPQRSLSQQITFVFPAKPMHSKEIQENGNKVNLTYPELLKILRISPKNFLTLSGKQINSGQYKEGGTDFSEFIAPDEARQIQQTIFFAENLTAEKGLDILPKILCENNPQINAIFLKDVINAFRNFSQDSRDQLRKIITSLADNCITAEQKKTLLQSIE